jgi:hypothetical protein
MANPEHLAILKQGVEAWNRWRLEHVDIRPDLTDADLARAGKRKKSGDYHEPDCDREHSA